MEDTDEQGIKPRWLDIGTKSLRLSFDELLWVHAALDIGADYSNLDMHEGYKELQNYIEKAIKEIKKHAYRKKRPLYREARETQKKIKVG